MNNIYYNQPSIIVSSVTEAPSSHYVSRSLLSLNPYYSTSNHHNYSESVTSELTLDSKETYVGKDISYFEVLLDEMNHTNNRIN